MTWRYFETDELVFVDKPDGIDSGAEVTGKTGLVELWEKYLGRKLWACHPLGPATSGAMVFAKTPEAAHRLRQDFENKRVAKSYWFLTDGKSPRDEFSIETEIAKTSNTLFTSDPQSLSPNSKTRFQRIKRSPFFELWEAIPETGKPHQIRLHARDLGIPILGDVQYGGSAFARLCLHAVNLQIPGEKLWSCPAPRLFERLGVLKAPQITQALCAIDRRQRQFDFLKNPTICLRLIEFESPGLQLDLLGPQLWLQWFHEADPTRRELEKWALVARILGRPLMIQKRWNRGGNAGPAPKWRSEDFQEVWTAREDLQDGTGRQAARSVSYEFRADSGESHGLFLDQRANRRRMAELAKGQSLLNLFAYTGGFGIAAAQAGATSITTVDLSKVAIEWSQKNFALNQLHSGADLTLDFFAADTFFFLERAAKKDRRWDLIVCDPPIFSRTPKGDRIFRIEKDLIELVKLCKSVLKPDGILFFSTHYEQWDSQDIEHQLRQAFPQIRIERGLLEHDVPQPPSQLKSFFLRF